MRLTADRIQLLMSYALTEYQARAYLALLENPMASAGTLARLSRVPRNRLYSVLEDLQQMGLVEIYLGEKRQYCALPFSNFLDKQKQRLLGQVQEIEDRRDYLDSVLQPATPEDTVDPDAGTMRVLRGRRAIREEVERMFHRAERSVTVILTAGAATRYELHLHTLAEQVAASKDPVRVDVWIPPECYGNGAAERLERILPGCIRPLAEPRHGILHIVDEKELLYVHPIPDDRRGTSASDFGFYTTNTAFTQDTRDMTRTLVEADELASEAAASTTRPSRPPINSE